MYITNKAQTKQVRKAKKKAVTRTNNLKANANLKQRYQGSTQHILPISNRGKLSKDEPNRETRGRTEQNLGRSCCLCP